MVQQEPVTSERLSLSSPVIFVLLLVLFGIGIWAILSSLLPSYRQSGAAVQLAEGELAQLLREEEEIAVLLSNETLLPKDKVDKTFGVLPEAQDVESLLANVEHAVISSGMELVGMNVTEKKESATDETATSLPPGVRTVHVNLSVNGPYERFLSLLQVLEDNARLLEVYTLEVKQAAKESQSLLEFSAEFFAYYYPKPQ